MPRIALHSHKGDKAWCPSVLNVLLYVCQDFWYSTL